MPTKTAPSQLTGPWPDRLEAAIKRLAADRALSTELGRRGIESFGNGGCLVLAEAIRCALGPDAWLVGVRERRSRRVDHVSACLQGIYADVYGVRDALDLLHDAQLIGGYHDPVIVPFTLADAARHQIPYADAADLVPILAQRLSLGLAGPPATKTDPQRPGLGHPA